MKEALFMAWQLRLISKAKRNKWLMCVIEYFNVQALKMEIFSVDFLMTCIRLMIVPGEAVRFAEGSDFDRPICGLEGCLFNIFSLFNAKPITADVWITRPSSAVPLSSLSHVLISFVRPPKPIIIGRHNEVINCFCYHYAKLIGTSTGCAAIGRQHCVARWASDHVRMSIKGVVKAQTPRVIEE